MDRLIVIVLLLAVWAITALACELARASNRRLWEVRCYYRRAEVLRLRVELTKLPAYQKACSRLLDSGAIDCWVVWAPAGGRTAPHAASR